MRKSGYIGPIILSTMIAIFLIVIGKDPVVWTMLHCYFLLMPIHIINNIEDDNEVKSIILYLIVAIIFIVLRIGIMELESKYSLIRSIVGWTIW